MIEFEYVIPGSATEARAPIVVNTDRIAHFEPLQGAADRCLLVLKDGRQIVAAVPYSDVRRLVVESRRGLATAL